MKIAKMLRNRKGFTLVELMVVVVILGFLAAVAVPMFSGSKTEAETTACKANLRIMNGAISQYIAVEGEEPAEIEDLVPNYLQSAPKCPGGGTYKLNEASDETAANVTCSVHGTLSDG